MNNKNLKEPDYGSGENTQYRIRELLLENLDWNVEFIDTSKADFIPTVLKLPFKVGIIEILHGEK